MILIRQSLLWKQCALPQVRRVVSTMLERILFSMQNVLTLPPPSPKACRGIRRVQDQTGEIVARRWRPG